VFENSRRESNLNLKTSNILSGSSRITPDSLQRQTTTTRAKIGGSIEELAHWKRRLQQLSAHTPASVWARTDEPERQATAEENQASRTSRSKRTWNQASQAAERTRDPEQSGGGQKLTSNSGGRIKILSRGYRLWHERPGEKISAGKANREAQKQAGTESVGELEIRRRTRAAPNAT
jgi:hypothetical protein